jgi:hypothetical protein
VTQIHVIVVEVICCCHENVCLYHALLGWEYTGLTFIIDSVLVCHYVHLRQGVDSHERRKVLMWFSLRMEWNWDDDSRRKGNSKHKISKNCCKLQSTLHLVDHTWHIWQMFLRQDIFVLPLFPSLCGSIININGFRIMFWHACHLARTQVNNLLL